MKLPSSLLLLALTASGCSGRYGSGGSAGSRTIVVRGSDTMIVLAQRWAEAYGRERPDINLQVSGGGSGTGIAALENGTADIATASRPMTEEERQRIMRVRGTEVVESSVCIDAIAVYVNPENPVPRLTVEQLADLFRGKTRRWSELGGPDWPVVLYSRENSSGTYAYFKEHVLKKSDFVAETQSLPGTAAVMYAVSHDRYGIGYGGVSRGRGVRVVPLVSKAGMDVLPGARTASSGEYPLARPLLVYRTTERGGEVDTFVRWLGERRARSLALEAGFFPLEEGS